MASLALRHRCPYRWLVGARATDDAALLADDPRDQHRRLMSIGITSFHWDRRARARANALAFRAADDDEGMVLDRNVAMVPVDFAAMVPVAVTDLVAANVSAVANVPIALVAVAPRYPVVPLRPAAMALEVGSALGLADRNLVR